MIYLTWLVIAIFGFAGVIVFAVLEWMRLRRLSAPFLRDGIIIRSVNDSKQYIMVHGEKRHIDNPKVKEEAGRNEQHYVLPPEFMAQIREGEPVYSGEVLRKLSGR